MTKYEKYKPTPKGFCGNCDGKGLLGHAVWCDEGHADLVAEVRRLRRQLKRLRDLNRMGART